MLRLLLLLLLHPSLFLHAEYIVAEPLPILPLLQPFLVLDPLLVGRGGMHTCLSHLLDHSLLLLLLEALLLVFLLEEVQHLPLYLLVLLPLGFHFVLLEEHLGVQLVTVKVSSHL